PRSRIFFGTRSIRFVVNAMRHSGPGSDPSFILGVPGRPAVRGRRYNDGQSRAAPLWRPPMPRRSFLTLLLAALAVSPALAEPPALPNPFYAMDTCTKRPYPRNDLPPAQQLDLLKELGYAGIAWTGEPPEQVRAVAAEAKQRGLRMFAIYCAARVTPEGDLTYSPRLAEVMAALAGHDTIIWLHLGGTGPAFASLGGDEPVVRKLRALAETAGAHGLRVAIY